MTFRTFADTCENVSVNKSSNCRRYLCENSFQSHSKDEYERFSKLFDDFTFLSCLEIHDILVEPEFFDIVAREIVLFIKSYVYKKRKQKNVAQIKLNGSFDEYLCIISPRHFPFFSAAQSWS